MKLALLAAFAASPAFAGVMQDSPAYRQAGGLTPLTSEFVYDNAGTPAASPSVISGDTRNGANPFLRGSGAPEARPEPANPITSMRQDDDASKSGGESMLKSPMVMVGGGAVLGGLVGYFAKGTVLGFALKGGLMGGLIGAAIGAAIGFMVMKFL